MMNRRYVLSAAALAPVGAFSSSSAAFPNRRVSLRGEDPGFETYCALKKRRIRIEGVYLNGTKLTGVVTADEALGLIIRRADRENIRSVADVYETLRGHVEIRLVPPSVSTASGVMG